MRLRFVMGWLGIVVLFSSSVWPPCRGLFWGEERRRGRLAPGFRLQERTGRCSEAAESLSRRSEGCPGREETFPPPLRIMPR